MREIIHALIAAAKAGPDVTRVTESQGQVWTNRALVRRMSAITRHVRRHARPGSSVALQTESAGLFWCGFAGICAAGCDVVPVASSAPVGLNDRVQREIAPSLWLDDSELRSIAEEESVAQVGDCGGAILLSSGTTGRSRFLRRSPRMLQDISNGLVSSGLHAVTDHVVTSLPLHHAYGLEHAFLAPALAGGRVNHVANFDPRHVEAAIRAGCTIFATVPPALGAMLDAGWPVEMHGRVIVAGTPLPASLRGRFERKAKNWELVDLYGATELGTIWLDRGGGGIPVDGVEVRLDGGDRGEILVRSRTMFDHYCQPSEAGSILVRVGPESWFRTGDVGHRRADGSLVIDGRCKLVFDVGGLKVNPFDVEAALDAHPSVRASLVEPIRSDDGVWRVRARIELCERSDHRGAPSGAQDLRIFLRDRVPAHAIPRVIEFVDRLPRSSSGKLLRETQGTDHVNGAGEPPLESVPQDPARFRSTRAIFDVAAEGYDWSSASGFLWTDGWYRRRELIRCGLSTGHALLDVGGGSGRTALIASSIVGSGGRVAVVDPSPGMRAMAARKGIREIHEGLAERLPVADSEFDLVVMGYMLRHVQDLETGFREALRALKPMGRICILEITEPGAPSARVAFRLLARWIFPILSWIGTRRDAVFPMMRLWADTMRSAPSAGRVIGALENAGFVGVRRRCELGIFTSYRAIKPMTTSGATAGILRANWPSANTTSPEAARTSNR